MKLYRQIEPVITIDETEYTYRDDFRTFLKVNAVIKDTDLLDEDKFEYIDGVLFNGRGGANTPRLIRAYLDIYASQKKNGGGKKVFDLEQDAEYIYASFYQCYNMDLFTAELTTEQFLALLRGLPKDCRLSEVIEIRGMELPAPNKANAKQRQNIIKAKNAVALKQDDGDNPFLEFGEAISNLAKANK